MSNSSIKGFKELTEMGQYIFKRTHEEHVKMTGNQPEWQVLEVVERKGFVEVHFQNGTWLHYTAKKEWY